MLFKREYSQHTTISPNYIGSKYKTYGIGMTYKINKFFSFLTSGGSCFRLNPNDHSCVYSTALYSLSIRKAVRSTWRKEVIASFGTHCTQRRLAGFKALN